MFSYKQAFLYCRFFWNYENDCGKKVIVSNVGVKDEL